MEFYMFIEMDLEIEISLFLFTIILYLDTVESELKENYELNK
jgi:hypothetical protein